jgi:hypothetical protein
MRRVVSLACALSLAAASHLGAQQPAAAPTFSSEGVRSVFEVRDAGAPAAAAPFLLDELPSDGRLPAPEAPARSRRGVQLRSVVHAAAGAALGAWLGLFTSQVVKSDWNKDSDSEFLAHRTAFAVGGALAGGTGGFLVGSRTTSPLAPQMRQAREEGAVISQEEVDASGLVTAYDVVYALEPQWLRTRGYNSVNEGARGFADGMRGAVTVVPGIDALVVYLDNSKMGGPDALREIQAFNVGSIRFLTPAQASYRWGLNHTHGVILVTSRQQ